MALGAPAAFGPGFQDEMRSLVSWVETRLANERQRRTELEARVSAAAKSAQLKPASSVCPLCAKHVAEMEELIDSLNKQLLDVVNEGEVLHADLVVAKEELAVAQEDARLREIQELERTTVPPEQQIPAVSFGQSVDSQSQRNKRVSAEKMSEGPQLNSVATPKADDTGSTGGIEKWSKLDRRMTACLANLVSLPLNSRRFSVLAAEIQALQMQRHSILEEAIEEERGPGQETVALIDSLKRTGSASMAGEFANPEQQQLLATPIATCSVSSSLRLRRRISMHFSQLASLQLNSGQHEKLCHKIGKLVERQRRLSLSSNGNGPPDAMSASNVVDSCLGFVKSELAAVPGNTNMYSSLAAEVDALKSAFGRAKRCTMGTHQIETEVAKIDHCLAAVQSQLEVVPSCSDKHCSLSILQGALKEARRTFRGSGKCKLEEDHKHRRCRFSEPVNGTLLNGETVSHVKSGANFQLSSQATMYEPNVAFPLAFENDSTLSGTPGGSEEYGGSGPSGSSVPPMTDGSEDCLASPTPSSNAIPSLQWGRGVSVHVNDVLPLLPEWECRRIVAEKSWAPQSQGQLSIWRGGTSNSWQRSDLVADASPLSRRVCLSETEFSNILKMVASSQVNEGKHRVIETTKKDIATISQLEHRIYECMSQLAVTPPDSSWHGFLSEEMHMLQQERKRCMADAAKNLSNRVCNRFPIKEVPRSAIYQCLSAAKGTSDRHLSVVEEVSSEQSMDSESETWSGESEMPSDERGSASSPNGHVLQEKHQTCNAIGSSRAISKIVASRLDHRIMMCISELASCTSDSRKQRTLVEEISNLQDQQRKALQLPMVQPRVEFDVDRKAEAVIEVISSLEDERLRLRAELAGLQAEEKTKREEVAIQDAQLRSEEKALKEELDAANATAERVTLAVSEVKEQVLRLQDENESLWINAMFK